MSFDPRQALREAGVLKSSMSPDVEAAFSTLNQDEVNLLVSLKHRIPSLPEVLAHCSDSEWSRPAVEAHGLDADAKCMCSVWSGAGQAE
ncbi:StsA-related sactipeptide RiPP [Nonomuraea typhae]|uniref:StsA-related sactipeptide RiPP n=1 Tax=Nonomuraea typhae TaxID=2603600 RepID=A0ABW7Z2K2_9ACTN